MEIVQYQSIDKLTSYFNKDQHVLIEDLQMAGFLCNVTYCKLPSCMEPLTLVKKNEPDKDIGYALVCRNCKTNTSLLKGSFFEKRKKLFPSFNFRQWFIIFQCWSTSIKVKPLAMLLNSKTDSILRAYMSVREVCTWKLMQHPELFQFGGEDHVVQVDEKFFPTEQKLNKPAEMHSKEWTIVIYDLTIKRGAVLFVPGLLSEKVDTIITNHILPGTQVKTRAKSDLNNLESFSEKGPFQVIRLDDCRDFVNPAKKNSCCIYAYWKRFINYLDTKGVLKSPRLPQHIDEFLWRDIYGKTPEDAYRNLLSQIRERYPCE